jgi:ribosome-associated protein
LTSGKSAWEKKAQDIVLLDLRGLSGLADYFLICSGESDRQVRAIAESIDASLAKLGIEPFSVEGMETSAWVLMDYNDLIVHIFRPESRTFYALDRLWGDAPRMEFAQDRPLPALALQFKHHSAEGTTGGQLGKG